MRACAPAFPFLVGDLLGIFVLIAGSVWILRNLTKHMKTIRIHCVPMIAFGDASISMGAEESKGFTTPVHTTHKGKEAKDANAAKNLSVSLCKVLDWDWSTSYLDILLFLSPDNVFLLPFSTILLDHASKLFDALVRQEVAIMHWRSQISLRGGVTIHCHQTFLTGNWVWTM